MRVCFAWALLLGASVFAAGCSCAAAHELDDASTPQDTSSSRPDAVTIPVDAFVGTDTAPSDGHYFTLEPAIVDLRVSQERCTTQENNVAILRVYVGYFSSCDTPGPIDVVLDHAAMTVTVIPHVWLEHGRTDCASVGAAYERDVRVVGLSAGTWSLAGGSTASTFTVFGPSGMCPGPGLGTGIAGSTCIADCQCLPGLSCVALRGDAVCAQFCGRPCETLGVAHDLSLSCASGDWCIDDPNLGWICMASSVDECSDASPCPAGMTCPPVTEGPRQCRWAITLDSSVRHACTTESDCDAGLDCVQRVDGRRSCEVRCTTSDMACPNATPHACMTGNWVCEWLGE